MSSLQPIKLHSHPGPNPWKIAILLEELNIPYTTQVYLTHELKKPEFLAINRNGMTPVIEDPNTGLVLAESGAITDYILTQYDPSHTLSFPSLPSSSLLKQWLQFQTTSQGPILQIIFRFSNYAPNTEARAAYLPDMHRVLRVLEGELSDKQWLVGGKCSAADLSFVPFHARMKDIVGDDCPDVEREYPNVDAWFKRMVERESVRKVLRDREEMTKNLAFLGKK